MNTSDLLVELGTEEIPASMLSPAARQLAELMIRGLEEERLAGRENAVWYTPRRIIVSISDIPLVQEDMVETLTGPPVKVALGPDGSPTRAAFAFAEKHKIPLSKLKTLRTPKGEYISAVRKIKGEKTRKVLERILPHVISKISFPKTMYWSQEKFRFARPIRWILAAYNGRPLRFVVAGIVSSDRTEGHRFVGGRRLRARTLESLEQVLLANGVMANPEERRRTISSGLRQVASQTEGSLLEDPDLLETVVNLNENPHVILGSFDPGFLRLPEEILVSVMREHQKYFSVTDRSGRLLPHFLAVTNLDAGDSTEVRSGHERVLRARLADAAFFWDTDRKAKLQDREEFLKSVLFQEKLGSYFDKTQRLRALVAALAEMTGCRDNTDDLDTAARLSKCDLTTEMVKEFTDLQGIVGGLYAQAEGYSEGVWRAVYEQYMPLASNSSPPGHIGGALLSVADRIDTITGCFSVGLVPSGSKDPFALRRQANGLMRILLEHRLTVSLERLVAESLATYHMAPDNNASEIRRFLDGRLRFLMEEEGHPYDCINAGLAVGTDDPLDARERIRALHEIRDSVDFLALASNFKRVKNILEQAGGRAGAADPNKMKEPAEQALWEAYSKVLPEVERAGAGHQYSQALRSMASLRQAVDRFFDEVLVMAEDPDTRMNRLSLLTQLADMFLTVADISEIVVERNEQNRPEPA